MTASGMGSMPGEDPREALRVTRDLLGDKGIPFLSELPGRGPGADLIGRSAAVLVGMAVDLQPSGWRLTDAAGRDARRGQAFLRQDLDELAEAYDGWTGPLKLQWCGPWTLGASVWLPRGERVLSDTGAARDLLQSVAEAARDHVRTVQGLVPGALLILQWDEPSLPAVLAGSLPTASGYGRVRPVDPAVVRDGLAYLADALRPLVTEQLIHCCAPSVPVPLIRQVPDIGLAVDLSLVSARQWDGVAELVESGRRLWAGALPTTGPLNHPRVVAEAVLKPWREVGLEAKLLEQVVVTPACGLAAAAPVVARNALRTTVEAAEILGEAAQGLSVP
ncbi:uroporphyrinogen decarboxylase/cobalamine-independent methonine synthase family protein [Calidifontibacter terrae]